MTDAPQFDATDTSEADGDIVAPEADLDAAPEAELDPGTPDVVIVGAGAAGLLAAVAARRLGHDVLVIEASGRVGGATGAGDGALWLPANDLMGTGGLPADSVEEALSYLEAALGPAGDDTLAERRTAFVRTAGMVARWLRTSKIRLAAVKDIPDEATQAEGAKPKGRVLTAEAIERRLVAPLADRLPGGDAPAPGLPVIGSLARTLARVIPRVDQLPEGGLSLVAELYRRATSSGVAFWFDTTVTGVVVEDERVTGVRAEREGRAVEVPATLAVLLASGGFEADAELRGEHLPLPTDPTWSVAGVPENTGVALRIAAEVGSATAALDSAGWIPVLVAEGAAYALDEARSRPHGMIVDHAGDRYFNEATSPQAAGRALFDRNRGMRAIPSYLVVDARHRHDTALGPWPAGSNPRKALDAGEIVKAPTLNELATILGVDRAGLIGSSVQFNAGAAKGRDPDFRRGESAADKARGDAGQRRNPCLGAVEKGPYWAVAVYPGDRGTKGGLVIDAGSRVLRPDDTPVAGLYACGGAAASVFGKGDPARGAALGAALVEAYRAVLRMSDQLARLDEATH